MLSSAPPNSSSSLGHHHRTCNNPLENNLLAKNYSDPKVSLEEITFNKEFNILVDTQLVRVTLISSFFNVSFHTIIKMIDLFSQRIISDHRILFTDWLEESGKQRISISFQPNLLDLKYFNDWTMVKHTQCVETFFGVGIYLDITLHMLIYHDIWINKSSSQELSSQFEIAITCNSVEYVDGLHQVKSKKHQNFEVYIGPSQTWYSC